MYISLIKGSQFYDDLSKKAPTFREEMNCKRLRDSMYCIIGDKDTQNTTVSHERTGGTLGKTLWFLSVCVELFP